MDTTDSITATPTVGRKQKAGAPEALRLLLRILSCTNVIETQLRTRLRQQFECTLPRFDLMAQLDRHPDGLKMGELSQRLMVTGGNVTGLTDKLVQEGLVERRDNPDDRRAYSVHLTPAGKELFSQMAKEHESWVVDLFAGLDKEKKEQLSSLLGELKQSLNRFE
jgi:DNA-binding MarR family transcriptional regulator